MAATEFFLESLLETEARIIAENETHAVLAVRVEKAAMRGFLQRNFYFVSAMHALTPATEKA